MAMCRVCWRFATVPAIRPRCLRHGDGSPFPIGYVERWQGRYIFGARRFGLTVARREAAARGIAAHLVAGAREIVVTAWLFLRLRPRDILPVAGRQLRY